MESYLTRNARYSTRPPLRYYSTGRVTIPKRITIARESNVSFVHDSFVPLNTFTKKHDAPGRRGVGSAKQLFAKRAGKYVGMVVTTRETTLAVARIFRAQDRAKCKIQ